MTMPKIPSPATDLNDHAASQTAHSHNKYSRSSPNVRMPAEWEMQDAILLAWPNPQSDWGPILAEIEGVLVEIARHASAFEKVLIAAPDPHRTASIFQSKGIKLEKVLLYKVNNNDTWARDFGPITVEYEGDKVLYDFYFNGWGLKYPSNLDNQINRNLAALGAWKAPLRVQELVLEGGSIESDGTGTILTTTGCLLNPNRNPQLDKDGIEQRLHYTLGAEHILWLNHGALTGDDTDGHVDTLARLCPQDTIVYVHCDDPSDEHFASLNAMEDELMQFRTRTGTGYRLLPLPWPQAKFNAEHERLPATYANYLVINGAVLVPTYADPADSAALEIIAQAYPEREIIGIDCSSVIMQHGSLHCLTMQLPKGTVA